MESEKKLDYKYIENLKNYGFTEFSVKPSLLKDYVNSSVFLSLDFQTQKIWWMAIDW